MSMQFSYAKIKTLVRLYVMEMHNEDGGKLEKSSLERFSEGLISAANTEKALLGLAGDGFVSVQYSILKEGSPPDPFAHVGVWGQPIVIEKEPRRFSRSFEITAEGISQVEDLVSKDDDVKRLIGASILWNARFKREQVVPAADRYVSVGDNQESFNELRQSLTDIKNEFAADHNKQELLIDNVEGIFVEIETFEFMIDKGWVSSAVARNLLETLKYIEAVCVTSSKILTAAGVAIVTLKAIFGI